MLLLQAKITDRLGQEKGLLTMVVFLQVLTGLILVIRLAMVPVALLMGTAVWCSRMKISLIWRFRTSMVS